MGRMATNSQKAMRNCLFTMCNAIVYMTEKRHELVLRETNGAIAQLGAVSALLRIGVDGEQMAHTHG